MLTPESLLRIKSICKISQGYRQQSDLSFLLSITKEIKLFKDLSQKQGENSHISCCQYLLYDFIPANQFVFRYGDAGNKFFILLSGSVSILIPVTDSGQITFTEIMTFTPGSSFGELALETSKPRSASALCKSDSHFLILMKKDYSQLMQRIVIEKKNEMIYFLQSLPAFKKINKLAISKLTYNIKEVTFVKGQYVFCEGDPAKEIYIVHEGECKLCKGIAKLGTCGIRKIMCRRVHTAKRVGIGSMIAEDDVINKEPHSYSCICASDTLSLFVIPSADFFMRITAEQPLKYLRKISKEKKSFLESWSVLRNSLDDVFVRSPKKIETRKNFGVRFNNIEKLNKAVTERRKLMTRNTPEVFTEGFSGKTAKVERQVFHKKSVSNANFFVCEQIRDVYTARIKRSPEPSSRCTVVAGTRRSSVSALEIC